VAVLAGIALVMFGIIFFRLWYLQILSGDKYLAAAQDNQVREIRVQAPRGKIVDRNGHVMVDNRPGYAVVITPDKLPQQQIEKTRLYVRLARVLGTTRREIRTKVRNELRALPFSTATVAPDVGRPVFEYILEHQEQFPGVQVEPVSLRSYPNTFVGAHMFGTVGEVTAQELKQDRFKGVAMGGRVGQSGIEYQYDRYLRGVDGANRVQVDARGKLRRELSVKRPIPGRQLRLSVDLGVERVGQQVLQGRRGGFVVMNVHDGSVLALGSSPSFDPNRYAKQITQKQWTALNDQNLGAPILNRVTQSGYPTGSTFKLVTSIASLESGLITPDTIQYDPGYFRLGGVTFKNAGGQSHGALALRQALTVSSDVFFYRLGSELNNVGKGDFLQRWAHRLGFGHTTGIDLPGEGSGFVPSPANINRMYKQHKLDQPWVPGNNVNLAVGQGFLAADPLQLAVAYSTVANGGYVVRPHLGERVEDAEGRVIQQFEPPTRRKVNVNPVYRQAILDGLRGAASAPGGTSTDVFKGFPIPIAGKTGTAEKGGGRLDQSW
jgi:penicillin-binding protein 2